MILDPDYIITSDNTILVRFGDGISEGQHHHVFSLTQHLIEDPIEEIINISPGYNSVLLRLNNETHTRNAIEMISNIVRTIPLKIDTEKRTVDIPVCYGKDHGPDMGRVMNHTGCTMSELVDRHTNGEYLVYFIGFSAGFPYIGGMDQTLETPRLSSPRKLVPPGSVGIAGKQTGIYPLPTPGGWNLIGRTPLSLFNVSDPDDGLIKMGDQVRFYPIDQEEFERSDQHS